MRATESTVGSAPVLAIDGVVDLAAVAALHNDLSKLVRRWPGSTVVVDLDGVDTLDDTGLGVLLGAAATARERGGDLEVVCTAPALRDRLARTGFDRAVAVRSTIS
jgi:anti-sigma B factor antagonist